MIASVIKRNKTSQSFDPEKVNKVCEWGCEGYKHVSPSQIIMKAKLKFFDGMTTDDIHNSMIKSAAELISVEASDYQYVAARLLLFKLRKEAYGKFIPTDFYSHITTMVENGKYDPYILSAFSEDEIKYLETFIDHSWDMDYSYASMRQWQRKYLIQDRTTKKVLESPQYANMLIAMLLFAKSKNRTTKIIDFYFSLVKKKVSLPTPIMGGLRSVTKQGSSCVLIESGDSLDSIKTANSAIIDYVSRRAGIGLNVGAIRAEGEPIRGGEAVHTGLIPFLKMFQSTTGSCSQGGIRKGATTVNYPIWHLEFENLIVLKNNRGVEENRVRHMDYCVHLTGMFYERLMAGGEITFFSPNVADGRLYDLFYRDENAFRELYEKLEKDPNIRKKVKPASEVFITALTERSQTGRIYFMNADHMNNFGAFDKKVAPVRMSNLCVAPETQILTQEGYQPIAELEGQRVNVWNGEEWSPVDVVKTGENQQLITVETSAGYSLDCTPYHKFYVVDGYGAEPREVRAAELKMGDKLIKFDLPVVEGTQELENAYINGFYSGDGCLTKEGQRIYLYHEKRELAELFEGGGKWRVQDNYLRMYKHYNTLKDKFFVPNSNYSIESRLNWLAGYLDADGCVHRNGKNEALTASSTEYEFLKEIQLMLQTLGVSSKVTDLYPEGYKSMSKNDGTGDTAEYFCKASYRLLISSFDSYRLLTLGLKLNRLKITARRPQRDAKQFVKVKEVVDYGRVDDTYCFTENKRHMGMFNGILTGQCNEIALPTAPVQKDETGEVALCTLAAFNLGEISYDELNYLAELLVEALDNLLDYQEYPFFEAEYWAKARRSLGIGVINYAYWLAKNNARYSDGSGNRITHELFERLSYALIRASNELAKERGACSAFGDTLYAKGVMPVDNYRKEVDNHATPVYACDWDALRESVVLHGMRNSTLMALMPSESSSVISNATNGIEPARSLVIVKDSSDGLIKQVLPEVKRLQHVYETAWSIKDNTGYLTLTGIMQKFVDQAISVNTYYVPGNYPDNRVPVKVVLKDMFHWYKLGNKTMYYQNTYDGNDQDVDDEGCGSGGCKI